MSILVAALISLSSYNAQVVMSGTKPFMSFTVQYVSPVDVDYQATFEVTYDTPSGPQTVGYVVITPAGSSGVSNDLNPFLKTWTMTSWELVSSGPYVQ